MNALLRRARVALPALAVALLAGCAGAPPGPGCPASAAQMPLEALYGDWQARIDGDAAPAQVRLWAHPDYAGLRGEVTRGGARVQLAGDVNREGVLLLDESDDGKRISAVWEAELEPRACGRSFRGQWRRAGAEHGQPFVLTRNGNPP